MINKDSYVWNVTTGTVVYLLSSLRKMFDDLKKTGNIHNSFELTKRIRKSQLLGFENNRELYLLALINLILSEIDTECIQMGYALQEMTKNTVVEDFPANVLLLTPPFSTDGNGLIFAEKAMRLMKHGRVAILAQTSAITGNEMSSFSKQILEQNTLLASILMADIFKGSSKVSTTLLIFDAGKAHDVNQKVIFIDMSDDGYVRSTKGKTTVSLTTRNIGDARTRYREVVDIVLGNKTETKYYQEGKEVFYDTISLNGDDWGVHQHQNNELIPTIDDFRKTVEEYMLWAADHL